MVNFWAALDSQDPRIGAEEKLVYNVLVRHANGDCECYPGYSVISKQSGLCRRTVANAVRHLKESGLVRVLPRAGAQGNLYQLPSRGEPTVVTQTIAPDATVAADAIAARTTVAGDATPCSSRCHSTVAADAPELLHRTRPGTTPSLCLDLDIPETKKDPEPDDEFLRFWKLYPHWRDPMRSHKGKTLAAWRRRVKEGGPGAIFAALESYRTSHDWTKDGGAYVPASQRWLAQLDLKEKNHAPTQRSPAAAHQGPRLTTATATLVGRANIPQEEAAETNSRSWGT